MLLDITFGKHDLVSRECLAVGSLEGILRAILSAF